MRGTNRETQLPSDNCIDREGAQHKAGNDSTAQELNAG